MSESLYVDLEWLPRPPADFRRRCRAVADSSESTGIDIRQLAEYALDENHMTRLSALIDEFRSAGRSLQPLLPFRLGILGNGTLDPIVNALVATAARYGMALECVAADFGQTVQEALDPNSRINSAKPDAVLMVLDYRGLPFGTISREPADAPARDSLEFLRRLQAAFRTHCGAFSIFQTLAPPPETLFGGLDRTVSGTLRRATTEFNAALADEIAGSDDVLVDVAALAETVGLANWYAPTQWNVAKLPFDSKMLGIYAEHVCRVIAAVRGRSRKCLILDLDNTLWGGVIGDDGLEGIVLGQGDPTGEAFLAMQHAALALRSRGIVLAVSSKNNDDVARAVFQQHPEMLLREHHISVFQANWNDKATNIKAIAHELALGTDAMVFVDDNPVERGLVRQMLPEVAVPELPENPALYARTLAAAGYFEAIAFSDEDRQRADFYQNNARRAALQAQAGDIDAYLASLGMTISFKPFDAAGRSRIAQLINKSNQFNLTTRRYSEAEVAAFETDPAYQTFQVRLADMFGDNGMIAVVICHVYADEWQIDTWLMSCRVLGRRVEQMMLREILRHARGAGAKRLTGIYVPTEKNSMVRDHYGKLGFALAGEEASGTTTWVVDTSLEIEAAPMNVERSGFDQVFA